MIKKFKKQILLVFTYINNVVRQPLGDESSEETDQLLRELSRFNLRLTGAKESLTFEVVLLAVD